MQLRQQVKSQGRGKNKYLTQNPMMMTMIQPKNPMIAMQEIKQPNPLSTQKVSSQGRGKRQRHPQNPIK
jgi:hypothetical protein